MQNLFTPHPYSTTVGILTERATDSGQTSEDWSLILEICDTINETDEGPKEAIRAIRKRITSSAGKDHVAIWYTLLLLEACIKNCGRRFYSHVANKEFLHDFLKLLSPKNEPSQQLQAKVLYMLKVSPPTGMHSDLQRASSKYPSDLRRNVGTSAVKNGDVPFSRIPSTRRYQNSTVTTGNPIQPCNVCHTYHVGISDHSALAPQTTRPSRVGFPVQQYATPIPTGSTHAPDGCSPHLNALRAADDTATVLYRPAPGIQLSEADQVTFSHPNQITDRMEFDADGTVRHLTSSQRIKLTQDLTVVETNVNVLNDMLAELRPDSVSSEDLTLLQELYQTCRAMHRRVIEFLSQVSDEEATPRLLQVNDNLTSTFSRYDRFEKYRIRALRAEVTNAAALDLASVRFDGRCRHTDVGRRPQTQQGGRGGGPMLAITAGDFVERPLTSRGYRLPVRPRLESREAEEDDDDSLIDISGEPTETISNIPVGSEAIEQWLAERQLVPTSETARPQLRADQHSSAIDHAVHALDSLALVPSCRPSEFHGMTAAATEGIRATLPNTTVPVERSDAGSSSGYGSTGPRRIHPTNSDDLLFL
ncbi:unnamed protein product [Calicophoron daubneyi]|uniref:TOM1-like protein 2 n=1 Tax=Calicophoron daubneyi TaxID=300641 RepID=A0AAV2TV30_CALDB